jgi:hypothetical protein
MRRHQPTPTPFFVRLRVTFQARVTAGVPPAGSNLTVTASARRLRARSVRWPAVVGLTTSDTLPALFDLADPLPYVTVFTFLVR